MRNAISAIVLLIPLTAAAQLHLSSGSPLNDTAYVRQMIKEISDRDLWAAIDLTSPGRERIRSAVERRDHLAAAAAWKAYWDSKKQPRYLTQNDHFALDTDCLVAPDEFRAYVREVPEERDSIIARAERILGNTIRVWGNTDVDFGAEVDFNRETGKSMKYGFNYWFWARPLLMAFTVTGDEKYLVAFDRLFNRWYDQRNEITRSLPEFDVIYYELGLGIRNRVFIEGLLLPYGKRTAETHVRYLKSFLGAGRWLYELQKHEGYRPGNWQVHGSYMLVQLALVYPEFRESSAWLKMGLGRLAEHLEKDFYADGGHSERSPRNYSLATYYCFRNLATLLKLYGVQTEMSGRVRELAGRTIDWWITMLAPTGEVPAINDSQRGLLPARVLQEGAGLFGKAYALRILHELRGNSSGADAPLPPFTSRYMPASGFTVMRSDWTRDALWMVINYGPEAGFHTHRDLLDFELYAFGKPLAVDAGIGYTYDDPLYESWYRSSHAHNMVTVGSHEISREGTQGEKIRWDSSGAVEYFAGEHSGYRALGITSRRSIVFVKPAYWFVLDRVRSPRDGDTLTWNLHSPQQLVEWGEGFRSTGVPGFSILPFGDAFARSKTSGWAASTTDTRPGRTEEIDWVRFELPSKKDRVMEFPVLLEPFRSPGEGRRGARISPGHFVVASASGSDHLYFIEEGFDDGEVKASGDLLFVREEDGKRRFTLLGGTFLSYRGKVLWRSAEAGNWEGGE